MMISAIVLTKNSSKSIKKCLQPLKLADEIIVIDDYSTDQTLKIVRKFGAKVFQRKLAGDFSAQKNFGLKKAKSEWVLFVDSDELISVELAVEIQSQVSLRGCRCNTGRRGNLRKSSKINGFYLKRHDKFLGKWLRFGETANVKLLRLARKNSGKWQGKVHETWNIKGKIKELKNPLLHDHSISVSEFLKRINWYSNLRAKELYQKKVKEGLWKIFIFPIGKFFVNYFVKLGILDGFPGLIMAIFMSWHSLSVRVKLRLSWVKKDNPCKPARTVLFLLYTFFILILYTLFLLQRGGINCSFLPFF